MPHSMRSQQSGVGAWSWMVRQPAIRRGRAPVPRLSGRTDWCDCSSYMRTTLAGVAAGAVHIYSWCRAADLKIAADRYVVTPNNVSIDGYGFVDVSVEPVVISVHALP